MPNGEDLGAMPDMQPVDRDRSDKLEDRLEELTKKIGVYPNTLLQFFQYAHLPGHLQIVSKPFCDLAQELEKTLPSNAEKTTAFRKLLEAKDCAVRAILFKQ